LPKVGRLELFEKVQVQESRSKSLYLETRLNLILILVFELKKKEGCPSKNRPSEKPL